MAVRPPGWFIIGDCSTRLLRLEGSMMSDRYTHRATVGPGGTVEIREPSLPEGRTVLVTVQIEEPDTERRSFARFLGAAPGLFATPEEVDAFIGAERDAWEQ
jgi:hypothetical protein